MKESFTLFFRLFTAGICLLYITVFLINVPYYYKRMSTECITNTCLAAPGPPPGLSGLQQFGINEQGYATIYTIIECIFILSFLISAVIVFVKRGKDIMGILGALLFVAFGTTFPSMMSIIAENNEVLLLFNGIMSFLGWSSLTLFFLLFPNGQFAPRWTVWTLIPLSVLFFVGFLDNVPSWVNFLRVIVVFSLLLVSQLYRYNKTSTPIERQQTKWAVYGFGFAVIGYLSVIFIPLSFNPHIYEEASVLFFIIFNSLVYGFLLLIPISLTFALLRSRLWDIDPLLNRTLLYGVMSVIVIGIYGIVVWYLSNLFKTNDMTIISIIATAIVAVSFSPIKEKVQKIIVRRMYGEQDNPFFILALLGQKIKESQTPEQILDQVTRTLKDALRLPFASITLLQQNRDVTLTKYGEEQEESHSLPISYRGILLGHLRVSPRSPGEAFTKSDERVWEVLIQQLGPLLQDLKTTIDLKSLNNDLQLSREKLVLAREEERQSMRRNLHDDLAPRLAALAYTAAAAEELVEREPSTVKKLLAEHQQMILGTVDDIRRLVYNLRPPTIDELGIVEALKQRIEEISSSMNVGHTESSDNHVILIQYDVPTKLPHVPAAVEVAVYRIITEAVVNVFRHSKASQCNIRLQTQENRIELEVTDNGIGYSGNKSSSSVGGIGVPSMMERAAELGGKCTIETIANGGTRVYAWIPIMANDLGEA